MWCSPALCSGGCSAVHGAQQHGAHHAVFLLQQCSIVISQLKLLTISVILLLYILSLLSGEFRQEHLLLGSSYTVHECRAALQHLRSSNIFGAALSSFLSALLGVSWVRSLLVSLPESVEGWRERNKLAQGWTRLLRCGPGSGSSVDVVEHMTSRMLCWW